MNLKKQAFWNTVGNTVYLFALLSVTIVCTHILGYKEVGALTLAMSFGNLFFFVQTFGIRTFQSSDMAFEFSPGLYLQTRLLTSTAGVLMCAITCLLLGYSVQTLLTILLFLLFKTSEGISDVLFGDDQRCGRLELAGYSLGLRGLVTAALFFAASLLFHSLNAALLSIAVGGGLITVMVDVPLYLKTVPHLHCGSVRASARLLRSCFPLFLTASVPMVITALPRILLERHYGAELLGYYGNISTPGLLLTTVFPVILTALLPGYGQMYLEGDYYAILRIWKRTMLAVFAAGLLCCLGVFLLGGQVLSLIYTSQIVPYISYLYYILFAMTLYALTCCNGAVLACARKGRILTGSVLLSLLLCVITVWPLVRFLGMIGAITSLALSYGAQAAIQAVYIVFYLSGKKGVS